MGQSIVNYGSYFDNYLIRTIDREDGLYRDEVYDTFQDSSGFIWIANYSFLFKYDGIKLSPFSESSYRTGIIPELNTNKKEDLTFLGVEAGIHTISDDSLITVKDEIGLTLNSLSSMSYTKGDSIFIGDYEDGLAIIFRDTVVAFFDSTNGIAGNKIEQIITDSKNRVWVATTTGISVFQNGEIINITIPDGLPDNSINTVKEMKDGKVWAGTETEGIVIFEDLKPTINLTKKDGLTDNSVSYIEQNPADNSIWIGFKTEGVDRFINNNFENLNNESGLVSNDINSINFDTKNRVYIGTEFGLSVLVPRLVDVIDESTPGFLYTETNSVDQDSSGKIFVGTLGGGLMIYEDGVWKNHRYSTTRSNESVSSIKIANDSTYYITTSEFGIVKYVNDEIVGTKNAQSGLTSNYIVCLETYKNGDLLVGTFDGLNIISNDWEISDTLTTDDGIPGNECFNTAVDKEGDIWVSTVNNGIYELRGTNVISHYDTSNGLLDNRVFGITEDSKGEIWAASLNYGFYRITDNGLNVYKDLPDNFVSVTEDNSGNFWFSSNGYIAHVKRSDLDKFDRGEMERIQYQRFTVDDGFPSARVNYGNSSLTKKIDTGEILITTKKGIAVINPEKTEADRSTFFPYFDGFSVDGESRSLNEDIIVEPSETRIEISFSALNISAPNKTRFRTKLLGVDEDWNYLGSRTTTYFDFLPNGKYILQVSALDQAGVWNDTIASLEFTVLPPFYKTWWFIGLCLLGFVSLGAGGVQIRSNMKLRTLNRELETQRKIQTERERISRELHDNVGSQITNLITGIEISNLHVKKNQQDKALSLLQNLDSDARSAMTDLRETIWLLDKEEVQFEIFLEHLKGFIKRQERYLKGMKIEFKADVNPHKILDPVQSMNLTRIIQEALNNARKYSEASTFKISFKQEGSKFNVILSDNGVGMETEDSHTRGNGIKNMHERAKEIGGSLVITSDKNSGTVLKLDF